MATMTATPTIRSASRPSLAVPGTAGKAVGGGDGFALLFAGATVAGPVAAAVGLPAPALVTSDAPDAAAAMPVAGDDATPGPVATHAAVDGATSPSSATMADMLAIAAAHDPAPAIAAPSWPATRQADAASGNAVPTSRQTVAALSIEPVIDVAGTAPTSAGVRSAPTSASLPTPAEPNRATPASMIATPVKPAMTRARLLATATMPPRAPTPAPASTPESETVDHTDLSAQKAASRKKQSPPADPAPDVGSTATANAPSVVTVPPTATTDPIEPTAVGAGQHRRSSYRAPGFPADPSPGALAPLPDGVAPAATAMIGAADADPGDAPSSPATSMPPLAPSTTAPPPTPGPIAPTFASPAAMVTGTVGDPPIVASPVSSRSIRQRPAAVQSTPTVVAVLGSLTMTPQAGAVAGDAPVVPATTFPTATVPGIAIAAEPAPPAASLPLAPLSVSAQPKATDTAPAIGVAITPGSDAGATDRVDASTTPAVPVPVEPAPNPATALPIGTAPDLSGIVRMTPAVDQATPSIPTGAATIGRQPIATTAAPLRIVGGAALQALSTPVAIAAPPLAAPAIEVPALTPATSPAIGAIPASVWPASSSAPASKAVSPQPIATDAVAARSSRPVLPSAPVPVALAPAPAPAPTAPTAVGATVPAAQAFAAAIEAADRQDRLAAGRGTAESVLAATAPMATAPIAATGGAGADQPSLDMRQQNWPGAMVDHIEKLRDAADATSTRIRVVPDALGSIDMSVRRHDDGAVQVSLVADRPQTQALIAEARPELTRLADDRGTRIEVSVGGGGTASFGGSADNRQPAAQPQVAQRRAPAPFQPDESTAPADGRVA